MARNTEKDAPYTVSIPRDSELLQMLKADAKDSNLSVAKLIVVRLSDYYKGQRATGAPVTTNSTPALSEEPPASSTTRQETPVKQSKVVEEQQEPSLEQPDENVMAALDVW